MPIWRLEPCDLGDPNWQASSHWGPVLVRASSEASARETAEKAFSVKTRFVPGKGTQVPPWRRPQLVDTKIVENAVYADRGRKKSSNRPLRAICLIMRGVAQEPSG